MDDAGVTTNTQTRNYLKVVLDLVWEISGEEAI
jgi:hypothetical protein